MGHLAWIIPLAIVVILVMWVISAYNGLVRARNETKNSWAQIDVQLKRRYDLIPNLVETAKGYMAHEKDTLEAVIKARQMAVDASKTDDIKQQIEAENMLTGTLRSLFAVTENYPDLKANQNMMELQEELTSTENRIAFSRQHYNDTVMKYNNTCEQFPGTVVAGMFNFKLAEFWEVEDPEERKAVKVQF